MDRRTLNVTKFQIRNFELPKWGAYHCKVSPFFVWSAYPLTVVSYSFWEAMKASVEHRCYFGRISRGLMWKWLVCGKTHSGVFD